MAEYTENVDITPHNFNTTTVTLKALTSEDTHNVVGLDTLEAARKESRWETQEVASGVSQDIEIPSTAGSIKFTFLESTATTDWLNEHMEERIQISVTDSSAPNLNCSGKGRLMVHPPIKRGRAVDVPEWEVSITYLKIRGGSYSLVAEV